tara:strand:- start:119 stop:466 length:348 start_codon:yes stop_codon:yes gene_type:complete
MKSIILTVAVAVLGLVSCTKVAPSDSEMIQGCWNNNELSVIEPTAIGEPAEWLNVVIKGNTWTYEGSEAIEFHIENDVIYFSNGGTNEIEFLSADRLVLSKTMDNGNFQKLVLKR